MRLNADRDRCVGAGACASTVPAVFEQDEEEGLVRLVTDRPESALVGVVRRAVSMCPAQAIRVSSE
ncbi:MULTISPECIES: ferredoxin [Streptomyces]|uniref:Ferredoxin n=1 Tax=Streptomyces hyderabadensis TaxID=598549 RepID=A0ABP9HGI3_9ACTN|nr:ferredoxin [Streptomyces hyderabadensis]